MADKTVPICVPSENSIKLVKWKIRQGAFVAQGQILFLYNDSSGENKDTKKFKASRAGTVSCIKVQEGETIEPGSTVFELEECRHTTVMKEMCAECGADLRTDDVPVNTANVPMVHSIPELKVSEELAQKLGREDADRLLKDRKLVLLVDLDQTLIHTTNDNVPPNLKGVLHFFLRGPGPGRWCHTRLRPRTKEFLESASKKYELHVCTFGVRQYAHAIAELLDPDKKYFSHRILSRDECFDARTKSANLKALFPCGDNLVCIIDDREDVWRHASNLIHVRPYSFFQSTGDINAPPALDEKSKIISGKNGSQVPTSVSSDLPTLDPNPEPDKKVKSEENKSNDDSSSQSSDKDCNNGDTDSTKKEESSEATEEESLSSETRWVENSDGQIEVEDPDDYLIYLEDILIRIHNYFYELYDKTQGARIPDLKEIIPEVKSKVLSGTSLVFSGLVPTHQRLETSRAYLVAKSLGAEVTQDFTAKSTHLVAVRAGTAKVHASRKLMENASKPFFVVTPDWLWTCAERWERVDERLYPLQRSGAQSGSRRPPAHCGSPVGVGVPGAAAVRKRTPSGRFMDTINPLLSFSSDDIRDMDREVEDIFNETDESSSDEMSKPGDDDLDDEENPPENRLISVENDEETQDNRLHDLQEANASSDSDSNLKDDDGRPRKRPRPRTPSDDETMDDDDSSWKLMGAALEREFLAQD